MKKLFPYLFYSEQQSYIYNVTIEVITEKLEAIFKSSGKFFSEPDFDGSLFSDSSFSLYVNSGTYTRGVAFGSTLYGKINCTKKNRTLIELKTKSSGVYRLISLLLIITGFALLYKAISDSSLQSFVIALGIIGISPFVCNWFAGVANGVVQDRYSRYIDKELRKINALNNRLGSNTGSNL